MLGRLARTLRQPAAAVAAAGCFATTAATARAHAESAQQERFQDLPDAVAEQRYAPTSPYGTWDRNWDYCELTDKDVAKALKHEWPITDLADAVRCLYKEHTDKTDKQIDKLIENASSDGKLSALYRRAYLEYAYGGGVTRHLILVRHGQYDEQRKLARPLEKDRDYGMALDQTWPQVDLSAEMQSRCSRDAVEMTCASCRDDVRLVPR